MEKLVSARVRPPLSTALLSARCLLRPVEVADAPVLFDATGHADFNRWLSWDRPADEAAIATRFARQRGEWEQGLSYVFSAVERDTGLVIGGVDFQPDPREPRTSSLNLGYWVHPSRHGQGYATEIVGEAVRWALAELPIEELVAGVGVENHPSHRVLSKLGFEAFERRSVCGLSKVFENVRYRLRCP